MLAGVELGRGDEPEFLPQHFVDGLGDGPFGLRIIVLGSGPLGNDPLGHPGKLFLADPAQADKLRHPTILRLDGLFEVRVSPSAHQPNFVPISSLHARSLDQCRVK